MVDQDTSYQMLYGHRRMVADLLQTLVMRRRKRQV